MTQKDRKPSFVSGLWNRIKLAFGNEYEPAAPDPRIAYRIRFLERCWVEDCLIEETRKQLERQWTEVSN